MAQIGQRAGGRSWATSLFSAPSTPRAAPTLAPAPAAAPSGIGDYLSKQQSPLAPYAGAFETSGRKYGVDPKLLVAISGAESSFGKNLFRPHNPFGWGGMSFASFPQAIDTVASGLAKNYLGEGRRSLQAIGEKYSPPSINPNWLPNVSRFYSQLGGQDVATSPAPATPAPTRTGGASWAQSLFSAPSAAPSMAPARVSGASWAQSLFGGSSAPVAGLNPFSEGVVSFPDMPILNPTSVGGVHATEGLAGYPAVDIFAKPGTEVYAPEAGTIERFSGHDPSLGAVEGAGGPLGWSIYLKGRSGKTYFLTHLGSRGVRVGEVVGAGQPIATVANYDRYGRPSHLHIGVST